MKQSETSKHGKEKRPPRARRRSILPERSIVIGEKLRGEVTLQGIVKYALYAVVMLFILLMKTTFFTRFRLFGASPDVLIAAVAAIGLFEGAQAGAVFGLVTGFAADALGGVGVVLLPLPYMLVGYICGAVASDYYRRSWLLFLVFDIGALFVRALTTLFYIMLTWHGFDLSVIIGEVIVPEMISTFFISPVPALMLVPVFLIFRKKKKELD